MNAEELLERYKDKSREDLLGELLLLTEKNITLQTLIEKGIHTSHAEEPGFEAYHQEYNGGDDNKFRELVEKAGIAIIIDDKSGKIKYYNNKFREMFGHLIGNIAEPSIISFVHPQDIGMILNYHNSRLNGKKVPERYEFRSVYQNRKISFHEVITKELVKDGELIGTRCYILDITKRKRAEMILMTMLKISKSYHICDNQFDYFALIHQYISEVMNADNFFIALFDYKSNIINFPYFVDEKDEQFNIVNASDSASLTAMVIRIGKPRLLKEDWLNYWFRHEKRKVWGTLPRIWLGVPMIVNNEVIGAIGVQSYDNPQAYGPEDIEFLELVAENVAVAVQKKKYEEALSENEKKLIAANNSKDRFFSILAHDLRSPFSGFMSLSSYLNENFDELSAEELKEIGDALNQSALRLNKLLENLLEWSSIQRGTVKINPERISLLDLFNSVYLLFRDNLQSKKLELLTEIETPTVVICDPGMLETILRNLLSNAIKFSHRENLIKVEAKTDGLTVLVTVRDFGVGIREDNMANLFAIDKTVTTLGTDLEKGTGLGLILCKEFVEMNGGKITVESTPGKGTAFTFTLPRG